MAYSSITTTKQNKTYVLECQVRGDSQVAGYPPICFPDSTGLESRALPGQLNSNIPATGKSGYQWHFYNPPCVRTGGKT